MSISIQNLSRSAGSVPPLPEILKRTNLDDFARDRVWKQEFISFYYYTVPTEMALTSDVS